MLSYARSFAANIGFVSASCGSKFQSQKHYAGRQAFHPSRGISYTTAKDIIKGKLGVFFDDLKKLGTHSLRSGGASDPGCAELPDFMVQAHGGWKSAESKNKYIQPSRQAMYRVSSSLTM
jgi:hypothetical protein